MDKYLRNWRQEAVNRGQNDAAIYIGDKVFALTNDDADAFWLAQVHFTNHNYARALALLSRSNLIARSTSCRYLAGHCYIKQGKYEQALLTLGEQNPDHLLPSDHNSRRRLQNLDGRGTFHTNRVELSNVGSQGSTRKDRIEHSEERERDREQAQKDIKFEAAMCHLRGLCYSRRNAFDRAKDCFKTAVKIDVQCFEAFDQLMKNSLLKPSEELKLLGELDFDSVAMTMPQEDASLAQEAAQFTRLLYTTRLSKYASPVALSHATETLSSHYNLAHNADLLLSRAEALYTQCRFQEALAITSSILNNSQPASRPSSGSEDDSSPTPLGHPQTLYPLHLACLYETCSHTALFLLSHTLSQHAAQEPYTYLAIGTYYLSTQRIPEARRFFSKASLMDPHSAAGWIGFAHTFAAEGEHDQAIAAYSTAVRLFQGSHLPQLFIGMQHLALNNVAAAWEHCRLAWQMSSGVFKGGGELFGEDQSSEAEDDFPSLNPSNAGNLFHPSATPSLPNPANTSLADSEAAGGDPLVLNELAVILYHQSQSQFLRHSTTTPYSNPQNSSNNLKLSIHLFRQSLALVTQLGWNQASWVATRSNLAHALRRCRQYGEALAELDECVRICTGGGAAADFGVAGLTSAATIPTPPDPTLLGNLHTSRGLVLMCLERAQEAVVALHEAVRVLGHRGDGVGIGSGGSGGGGGTGASGAAGGAGAGNGSVAAQLLSRALEVWGLEMARREERSQRERLPGANGSGRGGGGKAKATSTTTRTKQARDEEEEGGGDRIVLGLDGQADRLLARVLAATKKKKHL